MQKALDILRLRGEKPALWKDIRTAIITGRELGINEVGFPPAFTISEAFSKVFNEMIPSKGIIEELTHKVGVRVGTTPIGVETARGVRIRLPSELLIDGKNNGKPVENLTGVGVERRTLPGEIANLHTHPIDVLPSAVDLVKLIEGVHVFEGIISPRNSYLLFRTTKTPKYPSLIAEGYVMAMGKAKKKMPSIYEDVEFIGGNFPGFLTEMRTQKNWQPDLSDLHELGIIIYKAPRSSNLFTRMK